MLTASLAIESERQHTPHSPAPRRGSIEGATIIVAEHPLNRHQAIRAEIVTRDGKATISLSRWKNTPEGAKRTGQVFEFGAHRLSAVVDLLAAADRVLRAEAPFYDGEIDVDDAESLARSAASFLNQGGA